MAGQIPDDSFAGSLSDPAIDPFEIPEVPEPEPTPAGQARASAKPVPGPISPDKKLPPDSIYSRMRSNVINALGTPGALIQQGLSKLDNTIPPEARMIGGMIPGGVAAPLSTPLGDVAASRAARFTRGTLRYEPLIQQTLEDLKSPALTQEQPNPAYSPHVAAAAQGLGAMIDPSRYGMTGELLGMVGGALPGTMASQVPLRSIPVWGGAKMAMQGGMEEAPFREAMLKDFGPAIEPQLGDIYQKSKGIYESHIGKASLNELGEHHLPNLQSIVDQYNKGVEGQDWYLKTRPELERQFGPDSDLFINMLAATSPNATVPANMSLALKAYKAYKNGLTDFRTFSDNPAHPGFMKPVIDNLNHVIRNEPISGQKIINFAKNLRGETEPVTVDRWMMRALGMPKAPLGPNTYKFADYWLSQVAHDMNVEPRQLQAAVWKTAREVGGQSAATGQPFEAMLAKRLAKDPDLGALLNRVRQSGAPAAAGYAQGGHVLDGGWYGQNSPSPVRMADGGWWPSYLDAPQPNPAYGSTVGGYVSAAGQGVMDPVLGALQLGNRILGGPDAQDTDERIRRFREQYKQSLPGGKENRAEQLLRFLTTGLAEGAVMPEVKIGQGLGRVVGEWAPRLGAAPQIASGLARAAPKVASGLTEGALYGLPLPKESPDTFKETGWQALFSGLSGIGEQYLLPPAERGVAALASKWGASPETAARIGEQAAWRASDAVPDAPVPGAHEAPHVSIPPGVEHEAAAEAASIAGQEANPIVHGIARHLVKRAADTLDLGNYAGQALQPAQSWQPPSPPAPPTPDRQGYDPLADPLLSAGEPYARGGLYGQLRRASLQALSKPAP